MSDQRIGTRTVCLPPDTLPYGRRGPPHRPGPVAMVGPGRDGSRRGRSGGLDGPPRGRRLTATGTDRVREERSVETQLTEIAPDVYRLSTYVSDADIVFNQYLIDAEEPLLFHAGLRALHPLISAAVERVLPVERLRWITFGHVEADECGAMNAWLAAPPAPRWHTGNSAARCRSTTSRIVRRGR